MTCSSVYTMTCRLWCVLACLLAAVLTYSDAVYIQGTSSSYAMYPKWNACVNASISFDFRTKRDRDHSEEGLLMYIDDGGRYDFLVVTHKNGRVEVVLNIVDGRDGNVHIVPDVTNVNDDQWHSVKIERRRMQTIVTVDDRSANDYSFGSDPNFGSTNNSYVYFGGIPTYFSNNFRLVSLPSAFFQPRFKGEIRNVVYNNCTCQSQRVPLLGGVGITNDGRTRESCDVRNPCEPGCLCISSQAGSRCDCTDRQCVTGKCAVYST